MKIDFSKFLSRKFLVALLGMIVGVAVYFGADGSEIKEIAGTVVSTMSALGYIFGEAMTDVAALKKPEVITEAEQTEDKTVYY